MKQSGCYWQPEILNRCSRYTWNSHGNPDIVNKAKKKAKEILQVHQPKELDRDIQKEIKRIIKSFESQIQEKK